MKNIIILLLLCSALFSKEYIDVVHLKNGSIIKGIIIEQIPNKTIKIETSGGSIFVYQMDEVIKIVKEEKLVPTSNFSNHNPFKDKKLTSINPLGLVIGGISSLNLSQIQTGLSIKSCSVKNSMNPSGRDGLSVLFTNLVFIPSKLI